MRGTGVAALQAKDAAVFTNDSLGDPQAEAGAAFPLGGEEGLEEAVVNLWGDAGTVVGDGDGGSCFVPEAMCVRTGVLGSDHDCDMATFAGGLGCVGDEVGEDLAEFRGESINGYIWRKVRGDLDAKGLEAADHEQEQVVEHLLEVDGVGRLGLAVEAEHGAADLGDACEFALGDIEEVAGLRVLGIVLQEVEEVGDGVQRIVDLVGDGSGEAAGDGELLVGEQCGASAPLHGDVAEDHDDAGELAGGIADGGSAVVDGDLGAVFAD